MFGLAEEVVAHLGPRYQTEGLGVGPEAEDFGDIDLAGDVVEIGEAAPPAGAPVGTEDGGHLGAETGFDGGDGGRDVVVVFQRGDMFVEIGGLGGAATEGVDLGTVQAIKVVELHRRQRGAEPGDLGAGLLEFAAFVIGADDEDAHVLPAGGLDGGPVEVVDEIPVEVDVIEFAGVDGGFDDIGGGVGGKAEETAASFFLQLAGDVEATALFDGPVEEFERVDAVEGEEVHVIEFQVGHGLLEDLEEGGAGGLGGDLGLHDHFVARELGEEVTELHFGSAVAAGGLDVVDAELEGAVDAGFEIFLVGAGDVLRRDILPFVLVAHAATGDDGDLQTGPAKATVFHPGKVNGVGRRGKGGRRIYDIR